MKKTEFKIGETFSVGLLTLKCIKVNDKHKKCEQCFLAECWQCMDIAGNCMTTTREDKNEVIFVEVEE